MSERLAIGDRVECVTESVSVTVGQRYTVAGVLDWAIDGKVEQAVELEGVRGAVLASRFKLIDDGQALALGDDVEEPTVLAGDDLAALTPGLDSGPEVVRLLQGRTLDEFWLSLADGHKYHILSLGALSLVAVDAAHDAEIIEELIVLLNLGMDVRRHHVREAAKKIA